MTEGFNNNLLDGAADTSVALYTNGGCNGIPPQVKCDKSYDWWESFMVREKIRHAIVDMH